MGRNFRKRRALAVLKKKMVKAELCASSPVEGRRWGKRRRLGCAGARLVGTAHAWSAGRQVSPDRTRVGARHGRSGELWDGKRKEQLHFKNRLAFSLKMIRIHSGLSSFLHLFTWSLWQWAVEKKKKEMSSLVLTRWVPLVCLFKTFI